MATNKPAKGLLGEAPLDGEVLERGPTVTGAAVDPDSPLALAIVLRIIARRELVFVSRAPPPE